MVSNIQTILMKIKDNYHRLAKGQRRIADYILEFPDDAVECSISELASKTNLKSEASIVQFYKFLGFSGYKEFQLTLAQEYASRTFYHSCNNITLDDSVEEIKRKVFAGAMTTLGMNMDLNNEDVYAIALELLCNVQRIILIGHAASAAICYYANFRFTELGILCHFNMDSHINIAMLAQSNSTDAVLCISQSGETPDLIQQLKQAKKRDVPVVLISGKDDSKMIEFSDVAIRTVSDEANVITDAMSSRIVQMCIIDILFTMISITKHEEVLPKLMAVRRAFLEYRGGEVE